MTAIAAAALLIAAACGSGGDSGDSGASGDTQGDNGGSEAGGVTPGSRLRLAWNGPTTTLDPHRQKNLGDQPYIFLVYDRLIEAGPRLELEPMLATSWEFTDDGSALDLTLRDDVTFHDGTPFNADAVKANLERGQQLQGSTVATALSVIQSVEVLSPTQVRLHVGGPAASLPATLATNAGAMISPAALGNPDLDAHPVGSGPYELVEYRTNDRGIYTATDDDYWDDRTPRIERIELINIPDSATRLNALRAGEIDAMKLTIDQLREGDQLATSGEFELDTQPFSLLQYVLFLNNTRSELDDVRVREALDYATDGTTIAETLLEGRCEATGQLFPEGHEAHVDDIEPRYDIDKAEDLLSQAGLPDGFRFTALTNAGQSPNDQVTVALQEQLADAGVTMEIEPVEPTQAIQMFSAGQADAYMASVTGATDPLITIANHIIGGRNPGTVAPDIADLAARASDQRNAADREDLLRQLVEAIAEDTTFVPICFPANFYLADPEVEGLGDMSWLFSGNLDLRYVHIAE